ncbi:hypothetical protein HMI54_014172 [Coelomomyces lativittatus]|nr:hypothetical protein HMI54_014172 [Coelomomyces lativittatus]KAJ1500983.1 hypothetical protein HMI55_003638 [Coelomomyces lativittatus]
MASTSNIKVVCRFRPQNKREMTESGVDIIRYDENGETVFIEGKEFTGNFTFDRVFPSETTQALLFEYAVKSIVDGTVVSIFLFHFNCPLKFYFSILFGVYPC